ncbi:MAG TPA: TolC family protein [Verrucomicrobiae bacterium]|nr:TolC family protein [Verrucomicrobiae bacterium]
MKKVTIILALALAGFAVNVNAAETDAGTNTPAWLTQPLSLLDALNIALQQNAAILKGKSDLEASYGLVVQTRAIALPHVQASGQYKRSERSAIESITLPGFPALEEPDQNWNAGIQIVQDIYDGGKLTAAVRAARLTKEQALAQYQTVIADSLLSVREAYYDVLLATNEITVHEASVNLLQKELQDQQRRYDAGTVPHFNVLRAEVAVANEQPLLIQARNNYRIAKNNLSNLLGYNLPRDIWEDIPLKLTDTFDSAPLTVNLSDAIQQALSQRSELVALRKVEELRQLDIVNAKSGYQPTVQVFAGYTWNNSQFVDPTDLGYTMHGWNAGAQVSWDIFDGMLTHGKVVQAKALYEEAQTDLADESRQIELQVRTAYSDFVEAKEVLDSQKTVQAEAEEALREAEARAAAGTGTQLDVLDAQTSLTQARTTEVQALHDYDTARAKLQRAIGEDMIQSATAK